MKRDSYIPATNVTGTDKSNEEIWKLVYGYVEDVLIATPTPEDNIEQLDELLA